MTRHPWVAEADHGVRFGVQIVLGAEGLPRLLDLGRQIEALGFDGLYIFDHPSLQADPWVCLAALATATERVRLGSVVNCVFYRHPAHLARLAADLDTLSDGRLMLGLGIGWLEAEFRAFDLPFRSVAERHAALVEAITIIEGVWGPEPFTFAGEWFNVEALQIAPLVQQPRPPIMIGGSGERLALRQVARFADACNISEVENVNGGLERVGGAETVRRKLAALDRHCADAGRAPDEVLRTHFTLKLVLSPSDDQAQTKLARLTAQSSSSPATRRARPTAFVTGTPARAVAYYQSLAAVGIQYFVIQLDATDTETLHLLATEVMPHVR